MGALLHLFALQAMNRLIFIGRYSTSTDLQSVSLVFQLIKCAYSVLLADEVITDPYHGFVMTMKLIFFSHFQSSQLSDNKKDIVVDKYHKF